MGLRTILMTVVSVAGMMLPAPGQSSGTSAGAEAAALRFDAQAEALQDDVLGVRKKIADNATDRSRAAVHHRERMGELRERERAETERHNERYRELHAKNLELNSAYKERRDELVAEHGDLRDEMVALIAEKKKALAELRAGFFCDQCYRTKSEIEEQENTSFAEHLTDVNGKPVPAPPEKIAQKAEEYDRKIAAVEKRMNAVEDRADKERERYDERIAKLSEKFRAEDDRHNDALRGIRESMNAEQRRFNDQIAQLKRQDVALHAEWGSKRNKATSLRFAASRARLQAASLRRLESWKALTAQFERRRRERQDSFRQGRRRLATCNPPEGVWTPVPGSGQTFYYRWFWGRVTRADMLETMVQVQFHNRSNARRTLAYEVHHPLSPGLGPTRRFLHRISLNANQRAATFEFPVYSFFCPRVEGLGVSTP